MDTETQKICFLDIDGIFNHAGYGVDTYRDRFAEEKVPIDKENLTEFKKLLTAFPDLKIVWSTSWRDYNEEDWQSWKNPRLWLEAQDFMKGRIIGRTPRKLSSEHFHEILWWLKDNLSIVENYVILENDYFPSKWFGLEHHLIRVNTEVGLTADDVSKAMQILTPQKGQKAHALLRNSL